MSPVVCKWTVEGLTGVRKVAGYVSLSPRQRYLVHLQHAHGTWLGGPGSKPAVIQCLVILTHWYRECNSLSWTSIAGLEILWSTSQVQASVSL
jgi:hypothetical protein